MQGSPVAPLHVGCPILTQDMQLLIVDTNLEIKHIHDVPLTYYLTPITKDLKADSPAISLPKNEMINFYGIII